MDNPAFRDDSVVRKEEFRVGIHNLLPDVDVDIVLVYYEAGSKKEVTTNLFEKVTPNEIVHYDASEGDLLHILVARTHDFLSSIEINDQTLYTISRMGDYDNSDNRGASRVKLHNDLPDVDLDIVLVYDAEKKTNTWEMVFDRMTFDEIVTYNAYEGDLLQVVTAGTDTVVLDIEIRLDQSLYKISEMEILGSEL